MPVIKGHGVGVVRIARPILLGHEAIGKLKANKFEVEVKESAGNLGNRETVFLHVEEAPEEVELRVREATNEFARDVIGAVIKNRDDGASRIERDGQSWFRVAVTAKTIMTSLGLVTYRRAHYRSGANWRDSPISPPRISSTSTKLRLMEFALLGAIYLPYRRIHCHE